MFVAQAIKAIGSLLWLALFIYVGYVLLSRSRGKKTRISLTVTVLLLILASVASTLGAGLVVIDAGEVGVVFNTFTGTKPEPLYPGLHFVIPYIETVYRYSTREQVYTMTKTYGEGEVIGDDSLWSPTIEGLQVGIDSSTRYAIDPRKAPYVHNNFHDTYVQVFIRPTIRSVVRHYISQYSITDIYGPKRKEIQEKIEGELRERFAKEGFLLLSFDIRNVNFTEEYANAIEQKQIAQQEAERMKYVLEKERLEAERRKVEAEGYKQAAIIKAEGEAEALRLVSEALRENPDLLTYKYIEKLAPNVQVIMVPSGTGTPFILDVSSLLGTTKPETSAGD